MGQLRSQPPSRLIIPKIQVNAPVESIGLTAAGALGVPVKPRDAAWSSAGPLPGAPGVAIITGHFGWKEDVPAVFDDLHTLQIGDRIYLENSIGITTTFVVRAVRSYGEHDSTTGLFISDDGQAHLSLITCDGDWNALEKSYSRRLVVFADKE
ncbi:MAG: class F sortase [Patescibacteria group bacterium]